MWIRFHFRDRLPITAEIIKLREDQLGGPPAEQSLRVCVGFSLLEFHQPIRMQPADVCVPGCLVEKGGGKHYGRTGGLLVQFLPHSLDRGGIADVRAQATPQVLIPTARTEPSSNASRTRTTWTRSQVFPAKSAPQTLR